AVREREQLAEAKAPVAADARVRRLAARVAAHERLDDLTPELVTQVESHVWDPEGVTRLACRDHGRGRAARAPGVRAGRVEPEAQRDAHRARQRAQQRDRAAAAAAPPD